MLDLVGIGACGSRDVAFDEGRTALAFTSSAHGQVRDHDLFEIAVVVGMVGVDDILQLLVGRVHLGSADLRHEVSVGLLTFIVCLILKKCGDGLEESLCLRTVDVVGGGGDARTGTGIAVGAEGRDDVQKLLGARR